MMTIRDRQMRRWLSTTCLPVLTGACLWIATGEVPAQAAKPPKSLRLYVLDCGTIHAKSADGFSLKKEEVASTEMSVPCFLIVHPKGTMLWDAGLIPDRPTQSDGAPAKTPDKPLLPQLAAVGRSPADIKYLVLSHYHGDHVANANLFAGSTWLVRKVERDLMFSSDQLRRTNPADYKSLKDSKTILIDKDDYDVFGDGTVVIKFMPGHTPGHQSLFLKLKKTGPVVLSGDLYHHPEERSLNRLPVDEFDVKQTAESRAAMETFLQKSGAQFWIQHDIIGNAKLKKAPDFYE